MKSLRIFLLSSILLLFFGLGVFAQETHLPAEISEIPCSLEEPCSEGLECFHFPDIGLRCAEPNPCSYYQCPGDTECMILETYPPRVHCSPTKEIPPGIAEVPVSKIIDLDENVQPEDLEISEPKILPGSPFYFLKNWARKIRLFFAFNKAKKAELRLQIANEKLIEAKKLIELKKNPILIEKTLADFQNEIGKISEESGENLKQFSEKLLHQEILHQLILQKLENQVPPEVHEKIKAHRERHLERFAQVIQKVETKENIAERLKSELEKVSGGELKNFKNLEILEKIKEKMPEEVKVKIEEKIEAQLEKIIKEELENKESTLVGTIQECKWTMGEFCERNEGKCYCIETNEGCKILCATKEQKERLKDLVNKKVVLIGVTTEVTSTRMCPCYLAYTGSEEIKNAVFCPMFWDPVCGKDGKTYSNECFAKVAGVEVDYKGVCKKEAIECEKDGDCPRPRCPGVIVKCFEGKCITPYCPRGGRCEKDADCQLYSPKELPEGVIIKCIEGNCTPVLKEISKMKKTECEENEDCTHLICPQVVGMDTPICKDGKCICGPKQERR